MKHSYFFIFAATFFLLFMLSGCSSQQYGVGTYQYAQNQKVKKMEKVGAHGTDNRISQRDERKRIKYYNNPEYKRKLLEKRQKKKGKSPIDQAKSRG